MKSSRHTLEQLASGVRQTEDGVLNWRKMSSQAAIRACKTYSINPIWIPAVVDCTIGIIAVESKLGRSPRYHAKKLLLHLPSRPRWFSLLAPRAQGIAQIDRDRAQYLAHDSGLGSDLQMWSRRGAILGTALGLTKAISLLYPDQGCRPSLLQMANILITHNAGWMAPRVARLQEVLARLGFLEGNVRYTGFVGSKTLAALDLVASHLNSPRLSEIMESHGLSVPSAWGLTHPDIFPIVRGSDLFEYLERRARRVDKDLDDPKFPDYRIRRWYTGWISSNGYMRAVLTHGAFWQKTSTASLGGPFNGTTKYLVS